MLDHPPVRNVSRSDVERIVERDFAKESRAIVLGILDRYTLESEFLSRSRVQLAILKLSQGNVQDVERHTKVAKVDGRDVAAGAESPRLLRLGPYGWRALSQDNPEELDRLKAADWKEYQDWLSAESDPAKSSPHSG